MIFVLVLFVGTILCACPNGSHYIAQRDKCMEIVANGTRHGYFQAEMSCMQKGGHLASIRSLMENALLFALARGEQLEEGRAFIGALKISGSWTWPDNTTARFSNWAQGNPIDGDACATMDLTDTKWYSENCGQKNLPYFCEMPNIPERVCPPLWTLYEGHCYRYEEGVDRTWHQAQEKCTEMLHGANLASIKNAAENEFLEGLTRDNQCEHGWGVWIGLLKTLDSPGHKWLDGEPFQYDNIDYSISNPTLQNFYLMPPKCNRKGGEWKQATSDTSITHAFLCEGPSAPKCRCDHV